MNAWALVWRASATERNRALSSSGSFNDVVDMADTIERVVLVK